MEWCRGWCRGGVMGMSVCMVIRPLCERCVVSFEVGCGTRKVNKEEERASERANQ